MTELRTTDGFHTAASCIPSLAVIKYHDSITLIPCHILVIPTRPKIKKQKEGYYQVFNFEANPELIKELERNYRITDEIIKFMTIKVDE